MVEASGVVAATAALILGVASCQQATQANNIAQKALDAMGAQARKDAAEQTASDPGRSASSQTSPGKGATHFGLRLENQSRRAITDKDIVGLIDTSPLTASGGGTKAEGKRSWRLRVAGVQVRRVQPQF